MVPFAGYHLPVQYEGLGVLKEHVHTRADNCASLFDVSHMGQILWRGKDAKAFVEKMVVGDIMSLRDGEARLSLIMNEQGNIVDDTVITNAGDHIYMVVNGACKVLYCLLISAFSIWSVRFAGAYFYFLEIVQWKDMKHFEKYLKGDVHMEYLGEQQLLALQASSILLYNIPGI